MFKYELGIEVRDIVSGYQGIITARIQYLLGSTEYGIIPRNINKDCEKRTGIEYFLEGKLEYVSDGLFEDKLVIDSAVDKNEV